MNAGTREWTILAGALLLSLVGCAATEVEAPAPDDTGVVLLSITNAPMDAACLRITVKGATTAVRSLTLATNATTTVMLEGLPSGAVQFTAEAFAVGCAAVSGESTATWVSAVVPATLMPGQITSVSLTLHRPGRASVSVDFPLSCASNSACPSGFLCVGGVCKRGDGGSCTVNADCGSGVCAGGVCVAGCGGAGLVCRVTQICVGGACKTADGNMCGMSAECASGVCSGGACKKANGAACLMGPECGSGVCAGGVCVAGCGGAGLVCGVTQICVGGACKTADGNMCGMSAECASGLCSGGVCKKANGAACLMGPECGSGVCAGGVCVAGCGSAGLVCGVTQICVGGACKTADGNTCGMSAECASGLCSGGVCKKANGAACLMGPECGSGVCAGGVCVAGCGGAGLVCGVTQICVGGACKTADGNMCGMSAECASGLCLGGLCTMGACGGPGQSCCSGAQCSSGAICVAGTCLAGPSPGPALQWKFNESGGTSAVDGSGNALHGTYLGTVGAPTQSMSVPSAGAAGNPFSRAFVGANAQAVRLAITPAAIKPANGLTLAAWYRATSVDTSGAEVISAGDNYVLRLRSGQIEFAKRIVGPTGTGAYATCVATSTTHLDGRWHHLAAVTSTMGIKLYVDGVERCTNTRGENLLYDRGPDFWVGRHGNGSAAWDFNGNIDDVRIYPRALSAPEITVLAAAAQ